MMIGDGLISLEDGPRVVMVPTDNQTMGSGEKQMLLVWQGRIDIEVKLTTSTTALNPFGIPMLFPKNCQLCTSTCG